MLEAESESNAEDFTKFDTAERPETAERPQSPGQVGRDLEAEAAYEAWFREFMGEKRD